MPRKGGVLVVKFSPIQNIRSLMKFRHWRRRANFEMKKSLEEHQEEKTHKFGFLVTPGTSKDFWG